MPYALVKSIVCGGTSKFICLLSSTMLYSVQECLLTGPSCDRGWLLQSMILMLLVLGVGVGCDLMQR